jgi:hypothetical protein
MKPIGTIIQSIFGTNKVPAEPTVDQAQQLLSSAEEQEQEARASVASKALLLESVLATAALAPEDEAQRTAAGSAAVAHRKAKDFLEQAAALTRGARSKLEEAQGRETIQKRAAFEADANELLAGLARGSEYLEKLVASLPAAVAVMTEHIEKIRALDPRMAHEMPLLLGVPYRDFILNCITNAIRGTGRPAHPMTAGDDIAAICRRHLNVPPPKVAAPEPEKVA